MLIKYPDVSENEIDKLFRILEAGKVWKGTLKNIAKNGKPFYSIATVVPIKNKSGEILEYMQIRQDITEVINLHKELEDTQREVIYKMGEIVETRSEETGNHVKVVAEYSQLLALKFGLSQSEAELLKHASPMHDIGKVGIPDSLLNKPDKLSREEFEIMKSHTTVGYEILKTSNRPILKASAIVAYEHHEKWDGTGYPRGLSGEDIHIYGRITAVADVFDALGSERVYKKAWKLNDVLEYFKEEKGKHFDPKLVEIFFDNLDEFLEIREKYK
jgi:response regulator RpfG family c-di-GMP phosphodiesterase